MSVTRVGGRCMMAFLLNVTMLTSEPTGILVMNWVRALRRVVQRPFWPMLLLLSRTKMYLLSFGYMYSNLKEIINCRQRR